MGKISKHVCLALGTLALLASCGAESSSAPPVFSSTSKADTSSVPSSSASSSASSESSAGTSASSSPAEDVGLKEAYETYVKNAREKGENPMSYEEWLAFIKGEKGKSFTVTFDLGYEGKSFTQKVEEGKTADKPEDPLRNGYNFLDWVDVNGDHWVFNGYPITKDITLYATWSDPIVYTVTFVNNGGTVLDVQTGHYGDTLVYGGATPVAENQDAHYIYTFSGWDGDLVITGDATLTATYEMAYITTTAYYYDYDGTTLLASVPLAEGEEPHYDGATPTRERDKANKIQFEFEGWDKAEETADSVKFVARYASCTDGLDIEGDTVTYYHGTSTNVVIPSTWGGVKITKIGNGAFRDCSSLASVSIPSSVTSIGGSAFRDCSSLASASIPESVTSIGNSAFYGCSSLSSISIPDGVTSIGNSAFRDCSSLSSISIPDGVTSIGDYTFRNCSSLASVSIPSSVTSIGGSAFRDCSSLSSISIPDGVTSIGDSAFYYSSLTSVIIPSSVASIGNGAFSGCSSLIIYCESEYKPLNWDSNWSGGCPVIWGYRSSSSTDAFEYVISEIDGDAYATITGFLGTPAEVVVPSSIEGLPVKIIALSLSPLKDGLESIEIQDGVEVLGDLSFQSFSKLETVALPDTLKTIGEYAFRDCSSLSSISIPDGVASIGGWAFYGCSSLASIVIPQSVTSIDNYAFYGCSSLSSISVPDGVTSIGEGAFYGCSSLASIVIPQSVTSIGVWAFEGCASLASIAIPDGVASIKNYTFEGCSSLVSVVIPENVTSIGEGAFHDCSSLTSVIIPSSVTSIGGSAFRDCPSLSSIVIPESVTSIGVWVFYNCPSLAIYCRADSKPSGWDDEWNPDNRPVVWGYRSSSSTDAFEYDVCEIDGDAYATITGFLGTPTEVVVPSTVEGLPVKLSALSLSPLKDDLKSIEIQDGVEVLGDLSFQSFSKLETVALPDTLKTIGDYAFCDCSSLTSVTIPSSVTSIGGSAFRNCPSLVSIVIPESVTSIGNSAFLGCSSLTIYCEADSKPSGWNYYWNPDNRPVVWDYRG